MTPLVQKRDLILQRELAFADAIGRVVLEKPRVSFWMVLIPILFVYFIYRMQAYKGARTKFNDEFMVTRRRAMDAALAAVESRTSPDIAGVVRASTLPEVLHAPYAAWVSALVDHYTVLLAAEGDSFEGLVRATYRNRGDYLFALNGLTTVERDFYAALKPHLDTEGATDIIATLEAQSQQQRREIAEQIFR